MQYFDSLRVFLGYVATRHYDDLLLVWMVVVVLKMMEISITHNLFSRLYCSFSEVEVVGHHNGI